MEKILNIKNLTKYYGNTLAVDNLSLELTKGETFGFIGPNGAGKSTTIKSIMNLINKTNGEVFFENQILDKNCVELKKQIGYLPSEISLYEEMTVKQIFDYHQTFFDKDLTKRRIELVEKFKIDENVKIENLSLGNLKKVGIVLAFLHEPKLVILDEPTSGLDPIMQQNFYDLLKEENLKGTTIFYSTHILSEITKICNRVGIIKKGKLISIESIKELENKNFTFVSLISEKVEDIINELKVEIIERDLKFIKFKNTLDINQLIKTLSKFNIEKLLIEEATIEDIFLHFYE